MLHVDALFWKMLSCRYIYNFEQGIEKEMFLIMRMFCLAIFATESMVIEQNKYCNGNYGRNKGTKIFTT